MKTSLDFRRVDTNIMGIVLGNFNKMPDGQRGFNESFPVHMYREKEQT